jgi:hypothetical protein
MLLADKTPLVFVFMACAPFFYQALQLDISTVSQFVLLVKSFLCDLRHTIRLKSGRTTRSNLTS